MVSNVPAGVLSETLGHTHGMALGSFILGFGAVATGLAAGAVCLDSRHHFLYGAL